MRTQNEHGIILDWLLKVGIWLALIFVLLFDAGAIVVNRVSLNGTATDIAIRLSTAIGTGQGDRPEEVLEAAERIATEEGVKLRRAEIEEGVLHIRVRRKVDTLVVGRIGPIEDWTVATADGKSDI